MAKESTNTMFELFTCVNCDSIKQCSYILACFHVICGDCSESNKSNLKKCCVLPRNPQELVPHPLTKQYAQQLQSLYEVHSGDKEKNICVICQDMEEKSKNILFCVQCASFWCETHLPVHHRAMLKGKDHPFFRLDKDIELKELLTGVQGASVEVSDRENFIMGEFIQQCEDVISEGQEHNKTLTELNLTVNKWEEMVRKDLKERFAQIREILDELETEANECIENKCIATKERLESCSQENEWKLRSVYRGIELMQHVKNLCPNKAGKILSILTIDKIREKGRTSFVTFLLEMVPNISRVRRELELESNQIIIEARMIEPNHTHIEFTPDKQLYEGQELCIFIQTCDMLDVPAFSTNTVLEIKICKIKDNVSAKYAKVVLKKNNYVKKSQGYFHKSNGLETGNYQISLLVNNCEVDRKWKFAVARDILSVKQPTLNKLPAKGEAKAIAIHKNRLYVSTPALREVEVYSIDRGFYTEEKNDTFPISARFDESFSRFVSPKSEMLQRHMSLPNDSSKIHNFPNPKFGVSCEGTIGKGMLAGPHGICCYEDYIYVSDRVLHTIFCFTNIGAFIQKFGIHGSEVGEFSSPHGLTINKNQKLLVVADRFNDRVQLVDLSTGSMMAVGTSEEYLLRQPLDVAITMQDFYIVSTYKNDILLYDNNFRWISILIEEIGNPFHIAVDQTNQLYISSYTENKIYTILQLPHPLQGFNIQQVDIKEGEFPNGVAIGDDGTLYVVCHNTKEIPFEQLVFGW